MIINTKQIEYTLQKYTAYKLAKSIGGVSRQNLNYYKSGKYSINKMTIELASKIQKHYNEEMDEMEKFILDNLVSETVEWNEEGLLKGDLNDKFKVHFADHGDAQTVSVFHTNGSKANGFQIKNEDDAEYVKEQIQTYKEWVQ